MPNYISLVNWTNQGISKVKGAPQRLDSFKKEVADYGGKVTGFYLTMGRYDLVITTEFPSDEAAAALLLGSTSGGNFRTETLKAFSEEEFRNITANIQ
jgi:uncharacterized protein with GYD domain